jgi:capsular polysaccharide export protein
VLRGLADQVVYYADIAKCIQVADEIHTLTSLTGFEALLRGKTVSVYGLPFYGGWGLTLDRTPYPRPRRELNIDELVAGALLLYPLYIDPITRLPCDGLTYVKRLHVALARQLPRPSIKRELRAVMQALRLGRTGMY